MTDHTSELFPMMAEGGRDFEVSLRGYDKRQVDAYVARAEAELVALTAERDSAASRSADLAAQLANSHAQIESLRHNLSESSAAITPDNVDARMRSRVELAFAQSQGIRNQALDAAEEMRRLAEADASELRRAASADAERMHDQARADLKRATDAGRQRQSDADAALGEARAQAAELLNSARAEADRLLLQVRTENETSTAQARALRERLDANAIAARVEAAEDFEIALRIRRTEEQRVDAERHAAAVAEADRLVTAAQAEANRLVTDAQAYADRVQLESNTEATRLVTEAQAEADRLVREATAEAHRLVTEAQAEADRLVREATAESVRLVEEATADAHRRVTQAQAHADAITATGQAKVASLTDLRDRVHADLSDVQARMAQVLQASTELARDHVERGDDDAGEVADDGATQVPDDVADELPSARPVAAEAVADQANDAVTPTDPDDAVIVPEPEQPKEPVTPTEQRITERNAGQRGARPVRRGGQGRNRPR